MKHLFGAIFEVGWILFWVFTILTLVALKDAWVGIFTASPELGGLIIWAMMVIFALRFAKDIRVKSLSKLIEELEEHWGDEE